MKKDRGREKERTCLRKLKGDGILTRKGKFRDSEKRTERCRGRETERNGKRERKSGKGVGREEAEREESAPAELSRVVARFRDYSAAEDHREDYTPAAVEEQPLADPYIARRALLRSGKDESAARRGGARRVSSH